MHNALTCARNMYISTFAIETMEMVTMKLPWIMQSENCYVILLRNGRTATAVHIICHHKLRVSIEIVS